MFTDLVIKIMGITLPVSVSSQQERHSGILNNHDAYQRWVKTAKVCVESYQTILKMAGMAQGNSKIKNKEARTTMEI